MELIDREYTWQQHISYTKRTLMFIHSEFVNQCKLHEGEHHIRHYALSADYPLFDRIGFEQAIRGNLRNRCSLFIRCAKPT